MFWMNLCACSVLASLWRGWFGTTRYLTKQSQLLARIEISFRRAPTQNAHEQLPGSRDYKACCSICTHANRAARWIFCNTLGQGGSALNLVRQHAMSPSTTNPCDCQPLEKVGSCSSILLLQLGVQGMLALGGRRWSCDLSLRQHTSAPAHKHGYRANERGSPRGQTSFAGRLR